MAFRRKRQSTSAPVTQFETGDPRWAPAAFEPTAAEESTPRAPIRALSARAEQGLAVQKLRLGRRFVEPVVAAVIEPDVEIPVETPAAELPVDEPTADASLELSGDVTDKTAESSSDDDHLVITTDDLASDDESIATDDAAIYPSSTVVELPTETAVESTETAAEPADTVADAFNLALSAVPHEPSLAEA